VFRWYRAGWGRYTQADPLGIPADINLYRYADNNPSLATDPLGHQSLYQPRYPSNDIPTRPGCQAGAWEFTGNEWQRSQFRRWVLWYSQSAQIGWGENDVPLACVCIYRMTSALSRNTNTERFRRSVTCCGSPDYVQETSRSYTHESSLDSIYSRRGVDYLRRKWGKIVGFQCECDPVLLEEF
jgi:uncharacterized protein RhaS with RHS repeats